jgi:hypothetical protein
MYPVHGALRITARRQRVVPVPFNSQRKSWMTLSGSAPNVKLPRRGVAGSGGCTLWIRPWSPGPFHDTSCSPLRVLYLIRIFMPGSSVSAGCSKLCHRVVPLGDLMTRSPLLRS